MAAKDETKPSLEDEAKHILEEARMVLPGIQVLFGFQLIAVFSNRFHLLHHWQQVLHLSGLILVAISVGIIMTPTAYHRRAERGKVTPYFVRLSSALVAIALLPLACGISLDLFLVAEQIVDTLLASAILAAVAFCGLLGAWFVFPWASAARRRQRNKRAGMR